MDRDHENAETARRASIPGLWLLPLVFVVVLAGAVVWLYRDRFLPPETLYREAQRSRPTRAIALYERIGQRLPQIEEYTRLWAAELAMPGVEPLQALRDVVAFRPKSPPAYLAKIAIARHYASGGVPEAEAAYRDALSLYDTVALRRELAHYLEETGDHAGAYAEYKELLGQQKDAFMGMRRSGDDAQLVANDLMDAFYFGDAYEHLQSSADPELLPIRARALSGIGQYGEAESSYREWLAENPRDTAAQLGLAEVLERLGETDEALPLYSEVDTADSRLAKAALLETESPTQSIELYLDSPYPVAWWSATSILESQGAQTETLPIYERVGQSDTYLADDAAYRLYVLGTRLGNGRATSRGLALLKGQSPNWLALRAVGDGLSLDIAPPVSAAGEDVLTKTTTLETLGREDLAYLELTFAALHRDDLETDTVMARALADRGHLKDAQIIAEAYTGDSPPRLPAALWELSYPTPFSATVEVAASEFEVDPLLIWAIMRQESRYDAEAIGYAGERGLMQVMPSTQDWIAERLQEEIPPGDAFRPEVNVRMAAWFLRFLMDYFDGDMDLVVAGYNGGAGSVDSWQDDPLVKTRDDFLRWIGFGQTREYLENVGLNYEIYRWLYPEVGTSQ
jgi:soluble lytic murein transglycosylase